jgi:hypothetical protein
MVVLVNGLCFLHTYADSTYKKVHVEEISAAEFEDIWKSSG